MGGPMPRTLLLSLLLASVSACLGADDSTQSTDREVTIPPRGEPDVFDVGEWNLEFFGSPTAGPSDDEIQLARVRDVIAGADLDMWAVEEVVNLDKFNQLLAGL